MFAIYLRAGMDVGWVHQLAWIVWAGFGQIFLEFPWDGLGWTRISKKIIEYCTYNRRDLDVLSVLVTKFTGIRTVVQCWGWRSQLAVFYDSHGLYENKQNEHELNWWGRVGLIRMDPDPYPFCLCVYHSISVCRKISQKVVGWFRIKIFSGY